MRSAQTQASPPEISVIIATYNHGRFLTDALHSLIGGPTSLGYSRGQTFRDFEVIVVDDGSVDDTRKIVSSFTATATVPRVRYAYQANSGTPSAQNLGIGFARGNFIAILNADDMMEPTRLAHLHRYYHLLPQDRKHVLCDHLRLFANGRRDVPMHVMSRRDSAGVRHLISYSFTDLLAHNRMHSGLFYPIDAWREVGGYPESMRDGREDWGFNVQLGAAGWCGTVLDEPLYLYRRESQGRTFVNTTDEWHARFHLQMRELYAPYYEGRTPTMCCGGGPVAPLVPNRGVAGYDAESLVGSPGMTKIVYLGENEGLAPWYGKATGVRYKFSARRRYAYVDDRDVPGFLQSTEGVVQVFALAGEPVPVEQPA